MKDKSVLFEIKKFQGLITKELITNESNSISTTQYLIIKYLIKNRDKDVYQKDIEKSLNLTRATTSGVLGTMEKNGLIKRVASSSLKTDVSKVTFSSAYTSIPNPK